MSGTGQTLLAWRSGRHERGFRVSTRPTARSRMERGAPAPSCRTLQGRDGCSSALASMLLKVATGCASPAKNPQFVEKAPGGQHYKSDIFADSYGRRRFSDVMIRRGLLRTIKLRGNSYHGSLWCES